LDGGGNRKLEIKKQKAEIGKARENRKLEVRK
jgi:hypothetical protein